MPRQDCPDLSICVVCFWIKEIHATMKLFNRYENSERTFRQYGKIGSNLNQIAKYFNTGGERSLAMEEEIRHCISKSVFLRKEVLKMAGEVDGDR